MKKIFYLLMALCLVLGLTACGSSDDSKETTPNSQSQDSTDDSSKETSSEKETTTETPTTVDTKVYDVYVNGVGYDIGTTLEFKVTLTADDTEFSSCCPSFNVYMEGIDDPDTIEAAIDMDFSDDYMNPLLINNVASPEYDAEYYSYWGYYDLLALWESPDAEKLDITEGLHIYSPRVTFNTAGNYTVTVTSGNGEPSMTDWFAKYDNCFSIEISVIE